MFAIGNVDKEKFERLSEQFHVIFSGGTGIMEQDGSLVIPMNPSGVPDDDTTLDGIISNTAMEEDKMLEIKKSIEEEIEKDGYSDKVKVVLSNEGLEISIQDVVLFNSGDAEVLNSVSPLLVQISGVLNGLDNSIRIAGHTDNVPIYNAKYRSNWDLSAMRAINIMNFMVEKGGLQPQRFSIEGYGQYSPKYDNATEEGRAKNRRVEIFLIRKYPVDDKKNIDS